MTTLFFYYSNYVGNQFIIAIRKLSSFWYMTKIPWLSIQFLDNLLQHGREGAKGRQRSVIQNSVNKGQTQKDEKPS
jgi:hypothetical protein